MRIASFLLVGASSLVLQPVSARDTDAEASFEGEVVVTATVLPEEPSDLSATTRVLDAATIRARQATTAFELVTTLPGAQGARLGAPGQQASVFVRGAESDHVLVLWDGIPLNNPYFGGFNWAFLPTEGYDRVELVAGPYSALYGSDATGGVVNLVTSDIVSGGSLSAEGGSRDYLRIGVDAARSFDPVAVRAGGHLRRGEGEHPNADFDGESLFARLDWDATPRWRLGVLARGLDAETGIPFASGVPSPDRRIAWEEREIALPVQGRGDRWQVHGLASRVSYDSRFRDPEDAFSASDTNSEADRARVSATREVPDARFGDGWIAAGLEFERLEVTDTTNFGPNLVGAEQETRSGFVQTHWQGEGWAADAGLRYDDNDMYGSATSPRAGAVFSRGDRIRVRASYGEGFRAPSLGELFFPFFGNPDLRPEKSESWELGIVAESGAWRGDAVVFETRYSDLIDFDENFVSVNVGRARTRGVELSGAYRRARWEANGNVTLLEAENRLTGEPLRRRAEETATLEIVARPGDWTIDLLGRYVGERPDIDPATFDPGENPSFRVHDLTISWAANERVVPHARVENVLDEEYSEALGFRAPGRTWIVGLRILR